MKSIAQLSVDKPVTVAMLVLAVLLLGYISFRNLGMDLFPEIENPRLYVEVQTGERPPTEIEETIVQSIESLAARQRGVIQVSSVTRVGFTRVVVEYAWNTNMDAAFLDLQKALASIEQNPDIEDLTITQHDPNAAPMLLLAFSHPEINDMGELNRIAESYLQNELIRLEGVAEVRLLGGEEREVVVATDPYRLEAFGVTASGLASAIEEYNRSVSGGSIVESGSSYIVKGVGEFTSLEDIGRVIVSYQRPAEDVLSGVMASEPAPVYLRDVASISLRNRNPDTIVHLNGRRCMGLALYKETNYNTVQAVNTFMARLESVRQALPGYELTVVQNRGAFITNAVDEVKQAAIVGILLAMGVLFLFLRRVGPTLVISIAIPVSILATFVLMYFTGLTLNIMTLGGLALGAGMLVDNAIVVMESIHRNLETGIGLKEAAVRGTAQVSGAITASTLTTIVVFLPIVYLHGTAGALFRDQAWVVAFSLLSSLVVAVLVIPMLATRFTRKPKDGTAVRVSFPHYLAFLGWALDRKWLILALAAVAVAGSFLLLPRVGSEFIPRTGTGTFDIDFVLPEGTDLLRTADTIAAIEQQVADIAGPDANVMSVTGPSGDITGTAGAYEDENTAVITVTMPPKSGVPIEAVFAGVTAMTDSVPDVQVQFSREQTALELTMGEEQAPIVVEFRGDDLDVLRGLTEEARVRLAGVSGLTNLEIGFEEGRPELEVVVDRVRAGLYGVGVTEVVNQVSSRLEGVDAGSWETGGTQENIVVELPKLGVQDIPGITLQSGGRNYELNEIADIRTARAPKEITRRNQMRVGTVSADLEPGVQLTRVVADIKRALSGMVIPVDYRTEITGEERNRRESFAVLKLALILSILLMYMVLASQFESLIHPFTILMSVPFAMVGVVMIFLLLGRPFNIMAYIGIIMLAGIAVNDSIILVDCILSLQREGMSRRVAILEAARRRLRPIIMTSLTTILALLPLTLGLGEGAALRAPMALAVIGGLVTSTLLTLVVIPCIFSVLDRFRRGGDTVRP